MGCNLHSRPVSNRIKLKWNKTQISKIHNRERKPPKKWAIVTKLFSTWERPLHQIIEMVTPKSTKVLAATKCHRLQNLCHVISPRNCWPQSIVAQRPSKWSFHHKISTSNGSTTNNYRQSSRLKFFIKVAHMSTKNQLPKTMVNWINSATQETIAVIWWMMFRRQLKQRDHRLRAPMAKV